MKNLKTWIRRGVSCGLFLALLCAVVFRLDSALKLLQEENLCPRYYRYPEDTFDVIFLGSSFALNGIYPMDLYRDFGIASYNLATANQTLEASFYLAREAIEKDHPDLIVLDCNMAWQDRETMAPQYIHSMTDTMPYLSANRLEMIRNLSAEGEDLLPLYFPLIAYHSRWQELTYLDARPQDKEMVYGAMVQGMIQPADPFDEPVPVEENLIPESSRGQLDRLIGLCRESGTDLLLVSMPVLGKNRYLGQAAYNMRCSAAQQISEIAGAGEIPYLNWFGDREKMGFDPDRDTSDGEHLNRWGAEKLTRVLGQYMKEHYELPDRRGEGGAYAVIDRDAAAYPVSRMRDCLHRSYTLRDLAATLRRDASSAEGEPVSQALVLIALKGSLDGDSLSSEAADLLQSFGLTADLTGLDGHAYLAVIDGGKLVYETQAGEEDLPDSCTGRADSLQYTLTSGLADEETGRTAGGASIRVNRLEYTWEDSGLYFVVFDKATGSLMDACRVSIYSDTFDCTHDNH